MDHFLPSTYDGVTGVKDVDYHRSMLSHPSDSSHKYEARIPYPQIESDCSELWGSDFDNKEAAKRVAMSVSTQLDDLFKKALTKGEDQYRTNAKGSQVKDGWKPVLGPDEITEEDHLRAQAVYDNFQFEKRVAKEKTSVPVSDIVGGLVAKGRMTPEQAAEIKTNADLSAWLAENL